MRTGSSKPLAQAGTTFSIVAQVPTVSTQTRWFRWNWALAMGQLSDVDRCADRDVKSLTHGQSFAIAKDRYPKPQIRTDEDGVGRRRWRPMNFDYSDDQKFLKDEARKFLE